MQDYVTHDEFRRHTHDGVDSEKLNDGFDRAVASFETGEQGTQHLYIPFSSRIARIRGRTIKAIAATDNGTITVKNAAGATIATFTVNASTAIDTNLTAQIPSSNNLIAKDSYYQITTSKTTAGGRVLMTVEYARI